MEASLAVLRAKRGFSDASVHALNICAPFLGQGISMEFDRAGVSGGVGFGAREAELVGLRLAPSPQSEHLSLYC